MMIRIYKNKKLILFYRIDNELVIFPKESEIDPLILLFDKFLFYNYD